MGRDLGAVGNNVEKLEGVHVHFLRHMMGKKARRRRGGSWRRALSDSRHQEAWTQPLQTYIEWRQEKVAEWVALRTIFEICANETGYDGGGSHQEPWWWQVAENKQLRAMLEEILAAAKERRRWEFSRRGGGKIWEEKIDSESDGLEGGG